MGDDRGVGFPNMFCLNNHGPSGQIMNPVETVGTEYDAYRCPICNRVAKVTIELEDGEGMG